MIGFTIFPYLAGQRPPCRVQEAKPYGSHPCLFRRHRDGLFLMLGLALYCLWGYVRKLPCPIRYLTGISCPGCGMTRALISLIRLDFAAAWHYHPMIFLCVPGALLLIAAELRQNRGLKKAVVVTLAVLFTLTYLYRLFILHDPLLSVSPGDGAFAKVFSKFL